MVMSRFVDAGDRGAGISVIGSSVTSLDLLKNKTGSVWDRVGFGFGFGYLFALGFESDCVISIRFRNWIRFVDAGDCGADTSAIGFSVTSLDLSKQNTIGFVRDRVGFGFGLGH